MKILLKLIILIFVCTFSNFSYSATTVEIEVTYRNAADVFNLMDNVSLWWKNYSSEEYRDYWQKKFKITGTDKSFFKKYAEIRKKSSKKQERFVCDYWFSRRRPISI